jgi:DNA-binding NtrC family response regulator
MELQKPSIIIALDNEDSSNLLAGVLWLKGCNVYKVKSARECVEQIKKLDSKVDVVVTGSEIAMDRNDNIVMSIKKMSMDIKILAIGDESSDKTRILDYGADEFALKPLSPENTSDKILMLLARDKVAENRAQ